MENHLDEIFSLLLFIAGFLFLLSIGAVLGEAVKEFSRLRGLRKRRNRNV
jgi:hypothetical protein